jgi:starch synthase
VRPLHGYASALESWFPDVSYARSVVIDPRWKDCVNPLAVGIRLADAVNTVSPSYAREILEPADPARGFGGGEGLEKVLAMADRAGRLAGILNGCTYPTERARKRSWPSVLETLRTELARWIAQSTHVLPAHYIADKRLAGLGKKRPSAILTSIGRIVEQKVRLFREATPAGVSALEEILELLGSKGLFVMVGSGDEGYERYLTEVSARNERFVFLRGYSDPIAEQLYAIGDLFLMPSTFEPCGISQMLAMRAGQPCVVHGVGGLCDTVTDNVDGFVFGGTGFADQARAFVARVSDALELKAGATEQWRAIQQAAASARFSWDETAARYEEIVYGCPSR